SYLYQNNQPPQAHEQTVFFTDRSLYRPGQTIQFKGIRIRFEHDKDNYTTVANRDLTVAFNDVNGQPITKMQVKTNDYGSFNGSFTAPRDRLTGRMTIMTEPHDGMTQVSVEEYKRPKFSVTVEAPKDPGKLNEAVKVPGKAVSYSGVPIGGAKFTYRVTREVRYPGWYGEFYWWRPVPVQ